MISCDICGGPTNGYECDWTVGNRFQLRDVERVVVGDRVRREADLDFIVRPSRPLVGTPNPRRKFSARVVQIRPHEHVIGLTLRIVGNMNRARDKGIVV